MIIVHNLTFPLGRTVCMDNRQGFRDTSGNREAIHPVLNDIQVIRHIPDFFVNVEALGKEIDHVPVLSLIFEIHLHMFREVFKVPVVPDKTDLVNENQGVGRKFIASKVFGTEEGNAWYFPVTVNVPTFFLILKGKLRHQGRLAGSFFSKAHIELVGIPVTVSLHRKKEKDAESKNQKDISQCLHLLHDCKKNPAGKSNHASAD